jgi:hypothetical protein
MIENTEATMDAAHNALTDTDVEYGNLRAYVASSDTVFKGIKSKHFLTSVGTVAERDAHAYTSQEYMDYAEKLAEAKVELYVLEARRESWQREVDIWRTESANQRR